MVLEVSAAVRLHTRVWGSRGRLVVLLHGMAGDGSDWWQVGPAIADHGYQVIALDLPGHGASPSSPDATLSTFAQAVTSSLPAAPEVIIGHSLGGLVVAVGLRVLCPGRAVYVDVPFTLARQDGGREALAGELARRKEQRTLESLRQDRPDWDERDLLAAAESRARWDVTISASVLFEAAGRDLTPVVSVPSLVIRAQPSDCVPDAVASDLERRGFTVRSVAGAGHTVWAGRCAEFVTALDGWV